MPKKYNIIGLMSGTSLDGVDIAYCRFEQKESLWSYEICQAQTVPYDKQWTDRLSTLPKASALDYVKTDVDLGHYFGSLVNRFIYQYNLKIDFVASHGHTIFHQPDLGITTQIGNGAVLSAVTDLPVVCDFRTMDVAHHGQGAPLVPIGDRFLFGAYDYCLNIGGIANISFEQDQRRVAYDVVVANMALNYFANKVGRAIDKDGLLAQSGSLDTHLLSTLNQLHYYKQSKPKSLAREWFETVFLPAIPENIPIEIVLHTICHHIAYQISMATQANTRMLITGGGIKNKFLYSLLKQYMPTLNLIIPEEKIVDFKEALVFAFLGLLRWENKKNCLSSVTGADKDVIGGAIYTNQKVNA